jgi:hypothetical protein
MTHPYPAGVAFLLESCYQAVYQVRRKQTDTTRANFPLDVELAALEKMRTDLPQRRSRSPPAVTIPLGPVVANPTSNRRLRSAGKATEISLNSPGNLPTVVSLTQGRLSVRQDLRHGFSTGTTLYSGAVSSVALPSPAVTPELVGVPMVMTAGVGLMPPGMPDPLFSGSLRSVSAFAASLDLVSVSPAKSAGGVSPSSSTLPFKKRGPQPD